MILQQYLDYQPIFKRLDELVYNHLSRTLQEQGIYVTSIEHRIKQEASLAGKLMRKGHKYTDINSLTDIVGVRIITFYTDDVDKVAAIVKRALDVDWKESVDKRKLHDLDSFGYNSLHYICRLKEADAVDKTVNPRFELQMRTALQHVWSTIEHDTGYKGDVKIPREYMRQFNRLAGMMELMDDEFSRLRQVLTDYRRQTLALVKSGRLDDVPLSRDTFRNYLELKPFDRLNRRIAAVNQAEIYPVSMMPYMPVLESFHLKTLGDVQRFIDENSEDAYQLALAQLAITELDILSANIALQYLCLVHVLKHHGGRDGLIAFFNIINGDLDNNAMLADFMLTQAKTLPFMQKK